MGNILSGSKVGRIIAVVSRACGVLREDLGYILIRSKLRVGGVDVVQAIKTVLYLLVLKVVQ